MRFEFLGYADCPDWLLVEISDLCKLSSVRVKLLTKMVCLFLISPTNDIDYSRVEKYIEGTGFSVDDAKETLSALHFIVSNAVKHSTEPTTLANELMQLGLHRETCNSMCRTFDKYRTELVDCLDSQRFTNNDFEDIKWRVDKIIVNTSPVVHLQIKVNGEYKKLVMSKEQFFALKLELEASRNRVKNILNTLFT
ncbi:hypothetical protein PCE1_002139 [Barthelona sp. PCE]